MQGVQMTVSKTPSRDPDDFIARHKAFILKSASRSCGRFIRDTDDEWAVALEAFHKAMERYDDSRGAFLPFAELVIRRALTDHYRSGKRHETEILTGEPDENIPAVSTEYDLRLEIAALESTLGEYGISFRDLAECSPRAEKTKKACRRAARVMLSRSELQNRMRKDRRLPIMEITAETGISRKVIERHRKYIIAVTEILAGDYLYLSEYVKMVKEEKS